MRNNFWTKCFGFVLAASLTVVGCGGGGDDGNFANGVTGGGGATGGGGSTGGGTTGVGLTGSTGGTGIGGTGTTGPNPTGGSATATATSPTGGVTSPSTTGGSGFTSDMNGVDAVTALNNPTQFLRLGNRIYFVEGFDLGQSNGRLRFVSLVPNAAGTGFAVTTPTTITAAPGSPRTEGMTNPFGLVTDGSDLFISVGFGVPDQGEIVKVSNLNTTANTARFEDITNDDTAGFLINPAFMLVETVDGAEYCYWSEYSALGTGGRVRRVRTDGTGNIDLVVNSLNFAAGIATDGTNLVICDSDGGIGGQVVRTPLSFTAGSTPYVPNTPPSAVISPATSQQAIRRPFDVTYDGSNGFFFTEGNAIQLTGLSIAPTGQANGAVRYLPSGSTTATLVSNGLTNVAGIDTAPLTGSNVGLLFSESIPTNGRVLRRVVDISNVTNVAPDEIDIGLNRPLDVLINSATFPILSALVNYTGGQSNGLIRGYLPTP